MSDDARAAEKEWLAGQFDAWRRQVDALLTGISTERGGEAVWTGPAATRFTDQLRQARKDIDRLPEGFERTARNLRASAKELRGS